MLIELLASIRNLFKGDNQRNNFLVVFFVALLVSVIIKLFNLQITNGQYYVDNYVQKSIKEVTVPATRGNIYDKDGKILAYNELVNNVTIADVDAYPANNKGINQRNRMLLKLTTIFKKYNVDIMSKYFVDIDKNGKFYFTTTNENQHKKFIANVYGRLVDDLDEGRDFRYRSDITAKEAFEYSKKRYAMDVIKNDDDKIMIIDDRTMLNMIGIHYTMRLTSYQKYQPTTIAERISSSCATEILENKGELLGIEIEEISVRRYNYSQYFAHIIGHVGHTSENRINELKEENPQYDINDSVGLLGIEKSMEKYLCGTKGYKKIIVDSSGKILETLESVEPKSGNDVYLSITVNDQVANYHLLEQQLAGIVASKIVNKEVDNQRKDSSTMEIAATDAYYHLISNHVLDYKHFSSDSAMYAESEIYRLFTESKENVKRIIYRNLMDPNAKIQKDLTNEVQNYTAYVYTYLYTHNNILMSDAIDRDVEEYKLWKEDNISLRNFLLKAIEETWIDSSKIFATDRYGDRDTIYKYLVDYVISELDNNDEFDLLVYKFAIKTKIITNRLLCLAMFEQGFLPYDQVEYEKISKSNDEYIYTFFIRLIRDLKLKPSEIALDPCTGSVCVTDVNTGKIKVLVSYPSYDNNLIFSRKYFDSLQDNASFPLVSCSTQTQLAPGSSFKPITAVACLEEGIMDDKTVFFCDGMFKEKEPYIKCWAYPYSHDEQNIYGALKNSCNVIFAHLGYSLSFDETGKYSTDTGLRKLIKYATMFGLSEKSGIEIDESMPKISRDDPQRSAMGQGTHAFNNVQLAKFTVAFANGGHLYDLSIMDHIQNKEGQVIKTFEPKFKNNLEVSTDTLNIVKEGLRQVVSEGIAQYVFRGQDIEVCGKTGTAQERNDRPNHGVFVSFAPKDVPEIAVNVVIPFGYSSGNAAALANKVYNYQYNKLTFEEIISRNADNIKSISVSD